MDVAERAIRSLGVAIPDSSTCSHINSEYAECQVQTMCSLCITTAACEFDVGSLSCEAKSASSNGTATTYCSSNDTVCSTCTATAADPTCTGDDGVCICPSLCSMIEPADPTDCSSAKESTIAYISLAMGMMCVASLVFLIGKCRRRCQRLTRRRAFEAQSRHESEMLRMRQPQLALNLVGWRGTVDQNKLEPHKLDACSYVSKPDERVDSTESAVMNEEEPITSMETTSAFIEIETPRASGEAAFVHASSSESDYNAISDNNAAASATRQVR